MVDDDEAQNLSCFLSLVEVTQSLSALVSSLSPHSIISQSLTTIMSDDKSGKKKQSKWRVCKLKLLQKTIDAERRDDDDEGSLIVSDNNTSRASLESTTTTTATTTSKVDHKSDE